MTVKVIQYGLCSANYLKTGDEKLIAEFNDTKHREIIAIYLENGVLLDYETTKLINDTARKEFYTNEKLVDDFRSDMFKAWFYFGFEENPLDMSPSLAFVHNLSDRFIHSLSHDPDIEFTRKASTIADEKLLEIAERVPYAVGSELVNIDWIKTMWSGLSAAFESETKDNRSTIAEFILSHRSNINVAGRVFFHLVENKDRDYPFAFLATYSTGNEKERKVSHVPLKNALLEYKDQSELLLKLLSTVSRAADRSNLISEFVESGELFSPLKLTSDEAYLFLKEIPLYEESGILCRIPDWWKKKTNSIRLTVSIGEKAPSKVGLDALLEFDPRISLGDQDITKEEIEALLAKTNGLSFIKGKWVEVDRDKLRDTLDAYEKAQKMSKSGLLSIMDAMRMSMDISGLLGDSAKDVDIQITNGEWLNTIRSRLIHPAQIANVAAGKNFKGTLRPYQQTGLDWLATMKTLGFGALLADDMGLGKTVQILALLEHLRKKGEFKTLLIIPASLIGNWEKEITKFTPKLVYSVLHAKNTEVDITSADLFITTYGMTTRIEYLKEYRWNLVILDEAQAIKNPGTKQTKAVKQIQSGFKIAMTGTPIENRLSDLWSLFDFLNTGLLGTTKEFSEFVKGMQAAENYTKIRNVVSPFILRRLKTDKNVISDLPDKIELKEYAGLTKKQVVLYSGLVKEIHDKLQTAEGIERKGLVLASIIKFKQICNHPDQYLGQKEFDVEHSGKFEKLAEICETICEKRERVLVFTQFREMTEPLADYLEGIFGRKGLVLHGGTPVKRRTELVEQLCGREYVPFMVLSLKAGGVGLNLTGANHVIHFDRWWNPAVENQATDRAFRIGQTKNVMVHKFITSGTIEEKIDRMIEDKQKLAGDIIASTGENWITEMNNDELMKLFTLE